MRSLCTEEWIEMALETGGTASTKAIRFREFAVVPCNGGWEIVFVPMAAGISDFVFAKSQLNWAIEAMFRIDKLKNNWLGLEAEDWLAIRPEIIAVYEHYGTVFEKLEGPTIEVFPETFNGYERTQ